MMVRNKGLKMFIEGSEKFDSSYCWQNWCHQQTSGPTIFYIKKRRNHPYIYYSIIGNSQDVGATLAAIASGMDKEDVVCIQ